MNSMTEEFAPKIVFIEAQSVAGAGNGPAYVKEEITPEFVEWLKARRARVKALGSISICAMHPAHWGPSEATAKWDQHSSYLEVTRTEFSLQYCPFSDVARVKTVPQNIDNFVAIIASEAKHHFIGNSPDFEKLVREMEPDLA